MLDKSMVEDRGSLDDNNQFTAYYLNNVHSAQHTPTLTNCRAMNEMFPIKRKFQDMRHIMKKVYEISKISATPNHPRKTWTKPPNPTQTPTKNPTPESPYIIHKFIKSRRLMVTSSSSSSLTQKNKIPLNLRPVHRFTRDSLCSKNFDREQLSQIQRICEKENRLRSYFQKNYMGFEKGSEFQGDVGRGRKGVLRSYSRKFVFDFKEGND